MATQVLDFWCDLNRRLADFGDAKPANFGEVSTAYENAVTEAAKGLLAARKREDMREPETCPLPA